MFQQFSCVPSRVLQIRSDYNPSVSWDFKWHPSSPRHFEKSIACGICFIQSRTSWPFQSTGSVNKAIYRSHLYNTVKIFKVKLLQHLRVHPSHYISQTTTKIYRLSVWFPQIHYPLGCLVVNSPEKWTNAPWKGIILKGIFSGILLMEEILHHLECMKQCK